MHTQYVFISCFYILFNATAIFVCFSVQKAKSQHFFQFYHRVCSESPNLLLFGSLHSYKLHYSDTCIQSLQLEVKPACTSFLPINFTHQFRDLQLKLVHQITTSFTFMGITQIWSSESLTYHQEVFRILLNLI